MSLGSKRSSRCLQMCRNLHRTYIHQQIEIDLVDYSLSHSYNCTDRNIVNEEKVLRVRLLSVSYIARVARGNHDFALEYSNKREYIISNEISNSQRAFAARWFFIRTFLVWRKKKKKKKKKKRDESYRRIKEMRNSITLLLRMLLVRKTSVRVIVLARDFPRCVLRQELLLITKNQRYDHVLTAALVIIQYYRW